MNPYDPTRPLPPDESAEQPVSAEGSEAEETAAGEDPIEPGPAKPNGILETLRSLAVVLFVLVTSGLGFLITSGIVMFAVIVIVSGSFDVAALRDPAMLAEAVQSRVGFLMLVVIPQLVLVVPAVGMAFLSRVPTRQCLGLVRGHWPLWAWLAAAMAVPLVGMVSGVVGSLFLEESEQLKQMSEIFREHGRSGFLVPLALMIGLTPAVCEELLFRGFVQRRLTRAIGPLFGILLASITFAMFHWDPVHAITVLPIGLFLGWVAWRSGSLFPAMLAHFVNNVTSVVAVVIAPESDSGVFEVPSAMFFVFVLAMGVIGIGAVLMASVLYGRPQPSAGPSPEST